MSAFSVEGARTERATAVHQSSGVRILTIYVQTLGDVADDLGAGFPISGDMIAVIRRGARGVLERRRRRAARVCAEHEGVA